MNHDEIELCRAFWEDVRPHANVSFDDAMQDVLEPDFEHASKVHDWRNHVSGAMRKWWDQMPLFAKLALYVTAEDEASCEIWD